VGEEPSLHTKKVWSSMNLSILSDINHSPLEAGISKSYCATNSGSPEAELRFVPWVILFKY
jgi:hypothetical protein